MLLCSIIRLPLPAVCTTNRSPSSQIVKGNATPLDIDIVHNSTGKADDDQLHDVLAHIESASPLSTAPFRIDS